MSKDNRNNRVKKNSASINRGLASADKETREKVSSKGGKSSTSSKKNKK
jgi:hypothetical protein